MNVSFLYIFHLGLVSGAVLNAAAYPALVHPRVCWRSQAPPMVSSA